MSNAIYFYYVTHHTFRITPESIRRVHLTPISIGSTLLSHAAVVTGLSSLLLLYTLNASLYLSHCFHILCFNVIASEYVFHPAIANFTSIKHRWLGHMYSFIWITKHDNRFLQPQFILFFRLIFRSFSLYIVYMNE